MKDRLEQLITYTLLCIEANIKAELCKSDEIKIMNYVYQYYLKFNKIP